MDWKGQVAMVTGGSRGIGAATCRRLAARGAAVGINYVARSSPSRSAKRWGNRSSSKTSLLSLPRTTSGSIYDEVRRGSTSRRRCRTAG